MINRRIAGAALAVALVASVSACTSGNPAGSTNDPTPPPVATDAAFPVTIEHVYGTTVIPSQPERVATVAWANHEVPLLLGVVPVGMAAATWGDDDNDGVLPWVEDRLAELGAETPVLFDETDGIDYAAVAATNPDVILATYSGITEEEYALLSEIAPVVAFPEVAWGTSWEDMILLSSKAIGLEAEGIAAVADLEAQVATAFAQQPALDGASVIFAFLDPTDFSQIGFYTSHDTRPGFLVSVGAVTPTVVAEASATTTGFYTMVSAEEADRFDDVDLFVTYGDAGSDIIAQLQADPLLGKIPAIAEGRVAILENSTPLAASANPSPLSIGWGIDAYFALLAAPLQ